MSTQVRVQGHLHKIAKAAPPVDLLSARGDKQFRKQVDVFPRQRLRRNADTAVDGALLLISKSIEQTLRKGFCVIFLTFLG